MGRKRHRRERGDAERYRSRSLEYATGERLHQFAEQLRRRMTTAEKTLLPHLEPLGFVAQRVAYGYIPDFWHPQLKIVVECDGSIHNLPKQRAYDHRRSEKLRTHEILVLRFTNYRILNDTQGVVDVIRQATCSKQLARNMVPNIGVRPTLSASGSPELTGCVAHIKHCSTDEAALR